MTARAYFPPQNTAIRCIGVAASVSLKTRRFSRCIPVEVCRRNAKHAVALKERPYQCMLLGFLQALRRPSSWIIETTVYLYGKN
jgi:hypothetical protein